MPKQVAQRIRSTELNSAIRSSAAQVRGRRVTSAPSDNRRFSLIPIFIGWILRPNG